MKKRNFPNYSFQMRGSEAIQITYEGEDLGVFKESDLWKEFDRSNDPDKVYVIERAIETLEGKIPKIVSKSRPWKKGRPYKFVWTPIWNTRVLKRAPERYPVEKKLRRRRKSLLFAIIDKLRRLRL